MSQMTHERWQHIYRNSWEKALRDNPTRDQKELTIQLNRAMLEKHGPCPPKPKTEPSLWLRTSIRLFGGKDMLKWFKATWNWLNGKKLVLWSILTGIPLIWKVVSDILTAGGMSAGQIEAIGSVILLVVALGHKFLKALGLAAQPTTTLRQ